MELLGMVMLRISDQEFARIRVHVDNKDQRSLQFQVGRVGSVCMVYCALVNYKFPP